MTSIACTPATEVSTISAAIVSLAVAGKAVNDGSEQKRPVEFLGRAEQLEDVV